MGYGLRPLRQNACIKSIWIVFESSKYLNEAATRYNHVHQRSTFVRWNGRNFFQLDELNATNCKLNNSEIYRAQNKTATPHSILKAFVLFVFIAVCPHSEYFLNDSAVVCELVANSVATAFFSLFKFTLFSNAFVFIERKILYKFHNWTEKFGQTLIKNINNNLNCELYCFLWVTHHAYMWLATVLRIIKVIRISKTHERNVQNMNCLLCSMVLSVFVTNHSLWWWFER